MLVNVTMHNQVFVKKKKDKKKKKTEKDKQKKQIRSSTQLFPLTY